MLSKNCLIILTKEFPYSSGEPFLESELPLHLGKFDEIIILAQELDNSANQTRNLDKSVKKHNISVKKKVVNRVADLIKGVLSSILYSKVIKLDEVKVRKSFIRSAFLGYFEARAQRQLKEIKEILEKYDLLSFDRIYVYSYWFFVGARVAVLLKEWFNLTLPYIDVKAISRAHGYDLYEYRNRINYLPMREKLLIDLDSVYTCSENGRLYLADKFPNLTKKIQTSRLGTPDFGINSAPRGDFFHIVSCSRLVPLKRVDRILESLKLLKNIETNLKWTHIGGGKELEKFKSKAKEIDFIDIKFLGALDNKEVYNYYKNNPVHLFVNVSKTEGLPVSIMEAASFGIPTIATDVGGTSEIVVPNYSGELIHKDFENKDLAKKVEYFTKMIDMEYTLYRKKTRAHWEENFRAITNYTEFSNRLLEL